MNVRLKPDEDEDEADRPYVSSYIRPVIFGHQ